MRRAETPFYAGLKTFAGQATRFRLPLPPPWVWFIEGLHRFRRMLSIAWLRVCVMLYREPLFRRRCVSAGKDLYLELLPSIAGHARITIGDRVVISGALSVVSGRVWDAPELIVGNDVFIGHQVCLQANRRIVIEDGVMIAQGCYLADSNGHPIEMDRRLRGEPCAPADLTPVHIRRGAWLGRNCIVLRGVEIGEGAIVGAGSVVVKSVPPFTIAAGNPARPVGMVPRVEL